MGFLWVFRNQIRPRQELEGLDIKYAPHSQHSYYMGIIRIEHGPSRSNFTWCCCCCWNFIQSCVAFLSCGDDDITNFISSIASKVKIRYPPRPTPVQHTHPFRGRWRTDSFMELDMQSFHVYRLCSSVQRIWQSQHEWAVKNKIAKESAKTTHRVQFIRRLDLRGPPDDSDTLKWTL